MTTIAYHHKSKTIAADSRQTMNHTIVNDVAKKIFTVDGVIFATTGKSSDNGLFVDYYLGRNKSPLLPECSALVIDKGAAYSVTVNDDGNIDKYELEINFSVGSGSDFALAAMDFGKDAKEAVKYAMTRDMHTGGKVITHTVK